MEATTGGRAVVLGASMAGLLAARVLADRYARVVVVDRDELPAGPDARRGVPQGRHAHVLLPRGLRALEDLFPGLTGELTAQGAPMGDLLRDTHWHLDGHRLARADSGLAFLSASRPLLESRVRSRVGDLPAVTFFDRCEAVGLAADGDRVTGVRVLHRAGGSAEVVGADLVVDATGRGSRAPVWLSALGYPEPERERVTIGLGYATRIFRITPDALGGAIASLHAPSPRHPRGGGLNRLEGGRAMLTLAGVLGDHPPTDPEGFLAFAKSLSHPDIYEAVAEAESLDDGVAFTFPASVRHRYERLPRGFLVIGDSVCSFNPIYGQGMTVAALEALILRRHLRADPVPRPRAFLRAIAHRVDVAWELATGADLAFPQAQGRRLARHRVMGRYITRLQAAAARDAAVAKAFVRVSSMVDPPGSLLRPGVAVRVLRRR